jgi:hypothetical protein
MSPVTREFCAASLKVGHPLALEPENGLADAGEEYHELGLLVAVSARTSGGPLQVHRAAPWPRMEAVAINSTTACIRGVRAVRFQSVQHFAGLAHQ